MRIVIGSVLKPLTDVRHYHKIALSLVKATDIEITIVARESSTPIHQKIKFKTLISSKYFWLERVFAPFIFLLDVILVRPKIIIVCTHELLYPAVFYKWISGSKLIYDVQENYCFNILSNKTYNSFIKIFLSKWIGIKEKFCSRFIDKFWLAETCYRCELKNIISDRWEIFENKSLIYKEIQPKYFQNYSSIKILFSGTIAEENGIWEAIELVTKLNRLDSKYSLSIIGCCHLSNLKDRIIKRTEKLSFIKVQISDSPIDYEQIKMGILNSDIGIISYKKQANFVEKIPTKLFEYLSAGLPIILQTNKIWNQLSTDSDAAIFLDFQNYDPVEIDKQIKSKTFYAKTDSDAPQLLWYSYEEQLILSIKNIA